MSNISDSPNFLEGQRQFQTVEGGDVPRLEITVLGQQAKHVYSWRNMVGTGVMEMLDIDEPPVISVIAPTQPRAELVEQLYEVLDQLVTPHIKP